MGPYLTIPRKYPANRVQDRRQIDHQKGDKQTIRKETNRSSERRQTGYKKGCKWTGQSTRTVKSIILFKQQKVPVHNNLVKIIYTTKGDASVCLCAKFDQFLPVRSHFDTKHPVNFFHIATFPSPTFGPLFAFHCPLFFTKNNNLECRDARKAYWSA